MALEYEIRGDKLLWIKNPVTGVISYVVDLRGKSFAFTLSGREHHPPDAGALDDATIRHAIATCPFCPGNEHQTTPEIFRLTRDEMPHWNGDVLRRPTHDGSFASSIICFREFRPN